MFEVRAKMAATRTRRNSVMHNNTPRALAGI